jgi:hypothetical protein
LLIYYGNTIRKSGGKSAESVVLPAATLAQIDAAVQSFVAVVRSFETAIESMQSSAHSLRNEYHDLHEIALQSQHAFSTNVEAIATALSTLVDSQKLLHATSDEIREQNRQAAAMFSDAVVKMNGSVQMTNELMNTALKTNASFKSAADIFVSSFTAFQKAIEEIDKRTGDLQTIASQSYLSFKKTSELFQAAAGNFERSTGSLDEISKTMLSVSEQSFKQKVLNDIIGSLQKANEADQKAGERK